MLALASPASLKGVLSAREAATLLAGGMRARGRRRRGRSAGCRRRRRDGGGAAATLGGDWHTAVVSDPLGRTVAARWLLLPDGVAVVDAAEAVGLPLLRDDELDPFNASTRGLGELLLATLADGHAGCSSESAAPRPSTAASACARSLGAWLRDIPIRRLRRRNPLLGRARRRACVRPAEGSDADVGRRARGALRRARRARALPRPARSGRRRRARRRVRRARR